MSELQFRWSLLVATLVGFFLRVWRLDFHAYRGDETFAVWFVRQDWGALVTSIAANEPHPPSYYLVTKAWIGALGDGEFTTRFMPVVFATITVPLLGRLGWNVFGAKLGWTALAGAFLLALNPLQIWNAQDARMYTQSAAFALGSLVAYCQFDRWALDRRRASLYFAWTFGALWSHYAFLPLLAVQNAWFLVTHRSDWAALRRWTLLQAVLLIPLGAWAFVTRDLLARYVGNGDSPSFGTALVRAASAYLTGRSGSPQWALFSGLIALFLAVLGLVWVSRRATRPGQVSLVASTIAAGFMSMWVASLRGPVFSETYLVASSVSYPLFLAVAVSAAWQAFRLLGVALLASCVALEGLALGNYWLDPAYAKGADWRSEARQIERDSRAGDVIILNYPDPTFEYYYRGTLPVRLIPAQTPLDPYLVGRELDALTGQFRRIWLVPVRAANWDRDGFVESWLDDHADLVATVGFHDVRLSLYETPQGVLGRARPLDIEFAGGIRLRGVAVADGSGECAHPCQARIVLVWSARSRPIVDYKVFVHLVDSANTIAGQDDGVPAEWRRPTTGWTADELIVDPHEVRPALAAGTYRVLVGLYRENGPRLLTTAGSDVVEVSSLSVR